MNSIEKLQVLASELEYELDNKQIQYLEDIRVEIERLKERDEFLNALETAGVDNWSGYSYAYEILDEQK